MSRAPLEKSGERVNVRCDSQRSCREQGGADQTGERARVDHHDERPARLQETDRIRRGWWL